MEGNLKSLLEADDCASLSSSATHAQPHFSRHLMSFIQVRYTLGEVQTSFPKVWLTSLFKESLPEAYGHLGSTSVDRTNPGQTLSHYPVFISSVALTPEKSR